MMHTHSLEAFKQITAEGSRDTREKKILSILSTSNQPLSDYQILQVLKPNSDDMNYARPRITDLHNKGILIEGKRTLSHDGRRNVRTSLIRDFKQQTEMIL